VSTSSSNPLLPTFNIGGLASGLDTNSIVSEMMSIEKQPQQRIQQQSALEQQRVSDLTAIQTQLQSLGTAVASLTDPSTWTTSATIASSDPTHVAVSGSGLPPGGFAIGVSNLARAAQVTQTTKAAKVTESDTLHIVVGASGSPTASIDVDLTAGDTLDVVAGKINGKAGGHVFASVVDSKLVISGQETGAANTISVTSDDKNATGAAAQLGMAQTVTPLDATYTVDGKSTTSASNTITNIATGLTVTLLGVTSGDATVSIGSAGPNTSAVTSALQGFVSAYNATIDLVNAKVTEKKVANPQSTSDQLAGDLNGDPALLSILSQLREAVGGMFGTDPNAAMSVASEAGLSTGSAVGTGTLNQSAIRGDLKLDTSKLSDALASDFSAVKALFTNIGDGAQEGIARRVNDLVTNTAGVKGTVTSEISGENDLIASLDQQSADWDVRLTDKEAALRKQFSDMETALSQLQSQGSWLTGQIAKL